MVDEALTREILGNIDSVSRSVFYILAIASTASFAFGITVVPDCGGWGARRQKRFAGGLK